MPAPGGSTQEDSRETSGGRADKCQGQVSVSHGSRALGSSPSRSQGRRAGGQGRGDGDGDDQSWGEQPGDVGESRHQGTERHRVAPGSGGTQCSEKHAPDHGTLGRRRSGVGSPGRREEQGLT